jgi:hypothetical protein
VLARGGGNQSFLGELGISWLNRFEWAFKESITYNLKKLRNLAAFHYSCEKIGCLNPASPKIQATIIAFSCSNFIFKPAVAIMMYLVLERQSIN